MCREGTRHCPFVTVHLSELLGARWAPSVNRFERLLATIPFWSILGHQELPSSYPKSINHQQLASFWGKPSCMNARFVFLTTPYTLAQNLRGMQQPRSVGRWMQLKETSSPTSCALARSDSIRFHPPLPQDVRQIRWSHPSLVHAGAPGSNGSNGGSSSIPRRGKSSYVIRLWPESQDLSAKKSISALIAYVPLSGCV